MGTGLFTSDWGFCHTFALLVLFVLNILAQNAHAQKARADYSSGKK